MNRFHRPLLAASLLLTGCPLLEPESAGNIANIPTVVRPGGGAVSSGGGSSGGGTSGGGSTSGSGMVVEPSSAPSSISLSQSLLLHSAPIGSQVQVSGASRVTAVVAAPTLSPPTLQASWTGTGTAYRTAGSVWHAASDQDRWEASLRSQGARIDRTQRSTLALRAISLGESSSFSIASDGVPAQSVNTEAMYVHPGDTSGKGKFAIMVDSRDKTIFSDSAVLTRLANEIKDKILPRTTAVFGEDPPANAAGLSIGSDDTTYFVFSRVVNNNGQNGVLGYFSLQDLTGGNRRKALYIASDLISNPQGRYAPTEVYSVIAHEFQHLVYSWQRIKAIGVDAHTVVFNSGRDAWIDEGLAMLAITLNGYGPDSTSNQLLVSHVDAFLDEPHNFSLVQFFQGMGNPIDAYGEAFLFSQYLVDRFGEGIVKRINGSPRHLLDSSLPLGEGNISPTAAMQDALQASSSSLEKVFTDFGAAVALDGDSRLSVLDATTARRFSVSNINLRGSYGGRQFMGPAPASTSGSFSQSTRPFSLSYLMPSQPANPFSVLLSGTGARGWLILSN